MDFLFVVLAGHASGLCFIRHQGTVMFGQNFMSIPLLAYPASQCLSG